MEERGTEDHAHEGVRMMEPKVEDMTKGLFKTARSASNGLLCGAVMDVLSACHNLNTRRSPRRRLAP